MSEIVCPRAGKWIGGCRFEGRYDTPILSSLERSVGTFSSLVMEAAPGDPSKVRMVHPPPPKKTYVRDVCRTCGRTIERQETAA